MFLFVNKKKGTGNPYTILQPVLLLPSETIGISRYKIYIYSRLIIANI